MHFVFPHGRHRESQFCAPFAGIVESQLASTARGRDPTQSPSKHGRNVVKIIIIYVLDYLIAQRALLLSHYSAGGETKQVWRVLALVDGTRKLFGTLRQNLTETNAGPDHNPRSRSSPSQGYIHTRYLVSDIDYEQQNVRSHTQNHQRNSKQKQEWTLKTRTCCMYYVCT